MSTNKVAERASECGHVVREAGVHGPLAQPATWPWDSPRSYYLHPSSLIYNNETRLTALFTGIKQGKEIPARCLAEHLAPQRCAALTIVMSPEGPAPVSPPHFKGLMEGASGSTRTPVDKLAGGLCEHPRRPLTRHPTTSNSGLDPASGHCTCPSYMRPLSLFPSLFILVSH